MRITAVETYPVSLTMDKPVKMAHSHIAQSHNVLVKVTTDEGVVGWGEATSSPRVTGETQGGIVSAVRILGALITGENPLDRSSLWSRMSAAVYGNASAIGAIDIAVHDIAGKALGVPVHQLLGGAYRSEIQAMTTVGSGDPEADAKDAAEKYAAGLRWFKVKLGIADQETELDTVREVCAAVGSDAVICADANEAWTEAEAIAFIRALDGLPVRFLEQPIPQGDEAAMDRIATRVPVAICADEPIHSLRDIIRYAATAVGGVSLKLVKLGGITGVMRGAQLCEAHGMKINLAGKIAESTVAAAANIHCAAAIREVAWGVSPANQGVAVDVSKEPVRLVDGTFTVPSTPGLGIEVDEDRVEALATTDLW